MNEEANVVNNSEEKKETVQLKSSEEKYLKLLTDTIASLQVEIEYYENTIKASKDFSLKLEEKKEKAAITLENTKKELEKVQKNVESGLKENSLDLSGAGKVIMDHDDKKIAKNDKKIDDLESSLKELYSLKSQAKGKDLQKINRAIFDQQKKLAKVRKQNNRFSNRQRQILIAKNKINQLRERREVNQEAKVNAAANVVDRIEEKRRELGPSITDGIKDIVYDIREKHYKKRYEHQKELFERLKNGKNVITDANNLEVSHSAIEELRQRRNMTNVESKNPETDKMFPPEVDVSKVEAVAKVA